MCRKVQSSFDVRAGVNHSNHSDLEVQFLSALSNICNLHGVFDFYCCTVHFDNINIKFLFTKECTLY
jgi:hypothetical protein